MSRTTRKNRKSLSGEYRATEDIPARGQRTPFEIDVDQHRAIECHCRHCGLTETVLAEPGRRDRWTHEAQHHDHMIFYTLLEGGR